MFALQRLISRRISYLLVCLLGCVSLLAQSPQAPDPVLQMPILKPSKPRRVWSLSASIGASNLTAVKRNTEVRRHGWEEVGNIGAEVFLPRTNISIFGNLMGESLDVWDLDYKVGGLELGARYYMRPARIISPYVGLSGIWTFEHSGKVGDMSSSSNGINWIQTGDLSRISLSPSIGLDLKVFSFLSLTAEYNPRLPIGSSLRFLGTEPSTLSSISLRTNGLRHSIMLGVKVNFLDSKEINEGVITLFDWLYYIFGKRTTRY